MDERALIEANNYSNDERLATLGLAIYKGWDTELAEQLVERSKEATIKLMTPRDSAERFPTVSKAHEWYNSRPKVVYSLSKAAELAGVIWFSEQPYRGADKTFAIRLYDSVRGRGLAKSFAKAAHLDHELLGGYDGDTWLETGAENIAAQGLFVQMRYQRIKDLTIPSDRVRMMRTGIATRLNEGFQWWNKGGATYDVE
ncbi:MAG: hypothetical protein WAV04_03830 [Candidatus Microsaccharimonas sp.]